MEDDEQQDQDEDLENLQARTRTPARPMAGQAQADDEYGSSSSPHLANGRGYYTYTPTSAVFTNKPRYINEYRGNQRRLHTNNGQNQPRYRNSETDLFMQPMASVEHGPDGLQLNSLDEGNNYALAPPPPLPASTIYGNSVADMDNFNQIQTSPNLRRVAASRRRQNSLATAGRQRVGGGTGSGSQFNPDVQQPMLVMGSNEVVCGDCQLGTKRLNSRQFCHLHFAIKATILNKYMADDWTRFEVEIQDIFKSSQNGITTTASEQQSTIARAASMANNINNNMLMQADEPQLNAATRAAAAAAAANNGSTMALETQIDNTQNVPTTHRIKVGTIQSIWVPTEDLTCRCPRLKLQSTYLLMGSIDAKENSANALQLDRHGVALEWKSSLQEKLMRYQRRLSRGKC